MGQTIYFSRDNGQMACEDHRFEYGRIPWRKMNEVECAGMRKAIGAAKPADESLCEICSRPARMARYAARAAKNVSAS